VLQFQPTSTLHQVCNPTIPKSTLGTSTHQNKEPYTFRRSLNFETCTPWGGASKYKDELKKFFTSNFKTYFEALPEFEGPVQAMAPSDHCLPEE